MAKENTRTQVRTSFDSLSTLGTMIFPVSKIIIQPVLNKIIRHITKHRPELFDRIGTHQKKIFLIDPTNLPFVFLLRPDSAQPQLTVHQKDKHPEYNARIAGSFLTLLTMVDGHLDGDSLFFSRKLSIERDTEAVVCLRNALDDMDGSIAEDIASLFQPIGSPILSILRKKRLSNNE